MLPQVLLVEKHTTTASKEEHPQRYKYLVEKGISGSCLEATGYGESQLLNECADGVECTEEQHAVNRRTEFKVIQLK